MRDSWCKPRRGIEMAVDLWDSVDHLDAIIGPGCSIVCKHVGLLAAAWGIPTVSPSCVSLILSDTNKYPTFSRTVGDDSANILEYILVDMFGWDVIGVVATTQGAIANTAHELKSILEEKNKLVFFHKIEPTIRGNKIDPGSLAKQVELLRILKTEVRIIVLLMYGADYRSFLISAMDEGMLNGEYVFISIYTMYVTSVQYEYRPEADAVIYQGIISTDLRTNTGAEYDRFARRVIDRLQDPRFDDYDHLPPTADISQVDNYAGR